jgi:N-acyl-D-aspartate/D-glutamate deacylase
MGDDAVGGDASPKQIEKMVTLVGAALADGALGLSTSQSNTHNDGEGQPVPSRSASREELLALAAAVRTHPGTQLEAIIPGCLSGFTDDDIALLTDMSVAANRPLNWNVLGVSAANPEGHEKQLRASEVAAERGGRIVAFTLPHSTKIRLSFLSGFVLDGLPGWRETMHLPVPERLRALADLEVRRRLDDGAHSEEAGILRALANWERLIIVETFAPENADATGRTVGEVAEARGGGPFDTLLDVVIADELRTGLSPRPFGDDEVDWQARADLPAGAPRLVADARGITSVWVAASRSAAMGKPPARCPAPCCVRAATPKRLQRHDEPGPAGAVRPRQIAGRAADGRRERAREAA